MFKKVLLILNLMCVSLIFFHGNNTDFYEITNRRLIIFKGCSQPLKTHFLPKVAYSNLISSSNLRKLLAAESAEVSTSF